MIVPLDKDIFIKVYVKIDKFLNNCYTPKNWSAEYNKKKLQTRILTKSCSTSCSQEIKKNSTYSSTGCSVNECRMFLYKETANIIIMIYSGEIRIYFLNN